MRERKLHGCTPSSGNGARAAEAAYCDRDRREAEMLSFVAVQLRYPAGVYELSLPDSESAPRPLEGVTVLDLIHGAVLRTD